MSVTAKKKECAAAGDEHGAEHGGAEVVEFPRAGSVERRNKELVAAYQESRDPALLSAILERNQGLLHAVLKRFTYFPDPYEDLLQVANLGLIKAVQRFDCGRGIEFSSYATAIVDGEVRHHLRDNMLMRQPRWLKKLEKLIEEASVELNRTLKRPPSVAEIAEKTNVSEEGVLEVLKAHSAVSLHQVNDPPDREMVEAQPDSSRIRSLHYDSFSLPVEDRILLEDALDALSTFQRKIVFLLFFRDLTQSEVAEEMGLSQRKVSRESAKALSRMKAILNTKIF